jgi:hypothetical protein
VRRHGPEGDPDHPEPSHRDPEDQGQLPQEARRSPTVLPASQGKVDLHEQFCCAILAIIQD